MFIVVIIISPVSAVSVTEIRAKHIQQGVHDGDECGTEQREFLAQSVFRDDVSICNECIEKHKQRKGRIQKNT